MAVMCYSLFALGSALVIVLSNGLILHLRDIRLLGCSSPRGH